VTQQARNLAIEERLGNVRFPLHDRDRKFCGSFDAIVRSEGMRVIETGHGLATSCVEVRRHSL